MAKKQTQPLVDFTPTKGWVRLWTCWWGIHKYRDVPGWSQWTPRVQPQKCVRCGKYHKKINYWIG
jgi:hypothetical protein